jgi:hypothetical protein
MSRRKELIASFVGLVIGGWIGFMFWFPKMRVGPFSRLFHGAKVHLIADDTSFVDVVSWFAYLWLAILAVIIVHELGHLLAGWAAGLKLVAVRFGPVQISPPLRVSFQRNLIRGASGWTNMVPASANRIRGRLLVFVLGGPLANLFFGLAIALIQDVSTFVGWFAFASTLLGLVNLIPFQRAGLVSDGKRLLMLLQEGGRGERWMAIIQLGAQLRNGVLAEELNSELLAIATAIQDASADTVMGHLLAFSSSWYAGTDTESGRLLEICLRYSAFASPMLREVVQADAGVFQGRKRRRADLAEQWLADLPAKTQFPSLRERVEAAILEAKDDIPGALYKLGEVRSAMAALPDRRQRAVALKAIERWSAELKARFQASLPILT